MMARMPVVALVLALTGLFGLAGCRSGGGGCGSCRGVSPEADAVVSRRACPVSGEELGSTGGPVRAEVGGRTVFGCCQGRVEKVTQGPERYLAGANTSPGGP